MKRSVFIFISLLSGLLLASEKIEYRDAQGRLQGSARAQNGKVEYRDAQGRLQGAARAQNGKTEYRDAQGRFQGSAREVNGKTEYRDAQGRLQGSARKVNGKIEDVFTQFFRSRRGGQGVIIGNKEKTFSFFLKFAHLTHSAEIVAQMGQTRGLDSCKNTHNILSSLIKSYKVQHHCRRSR